MDRKSEHDSEGFEMTYHGYVQNGKVIVADAIELPEGAPVEVKLVRSKTRAQSHAPHESDLTVNRRLLKYAGKACDLPADAARNLDHYLYGHPKQ